MVLKNIIGFVVGVITAIIANFLAVLILTLLVSIPIIGKILSFPSTPDLYITSGGIAAGYSIALLVCTKICARTKTGRRPGVIALHVVLVFFCLTSAISAWINTPFYDVTWVFTLATVILAGMLISAIKEPSLYDDTSKELSESTREVN